MDHVSGTHGGYPGHEPVDVFWTKADDTGPQKDVCNRTDDPDLPPGDLPERTQQILDRPGWLHEHRKAV